MLLKCLCFDEVVPKMEWAKKGASLADDLRQVKIDDVDRLVVQFAHGVLHHILLLYWPNYKT